MQSVIEDDAIGVGERILQQKELRLHMLSKVPCCPAIGGPENTEGCPLCEDVQEELSVGRIIPNKQNQLWGGGPPVRKASCFLEHATPPRHLWWSSIVSNQALLDVLARRARTKWFTSKLFQ